MQSAEESRNGEEDDSGRQENVISNFDEVKENPMPTG